MRRPPMWFMDSRHGTRYMCRTRRRHFFRTNLWRLPKLREAQRHWLAEFERLKAELAAAPSEELYTQTMNAGALALAFIDCEREILASLPSFNSKWWGRKERNRR